MTWLHHLWFTYCWPSDLGNGPEAGQELAAGAVAGALLWPPLRRRIHRFADAKAAHLHDKLDRVAAHHADLQHRIDHIIRHHPDVPPYPGPVDPQTKEPT